MLFNALTESDEHNYPTLIERFEHSGRVLAEQDGKLDGRLGILQESVDMLIAACNKILPDAPELMIKVTTHLYQLYTQSSLALTRGYHHARDQQALSTQRATESLELRLKALQRINALSNSATDLDQTLEVTARSVAEDRYLLPRL